MYSCVYVRTWLTSRPLFVLQGEARQENEKRNTFPIKYQDCSTLYCSALCSSALCYSMALILIGIRGMSVSVLTGDVRYGTLQYCTHYTSTDHCPPPLICWKARGSLHCTCVSSPSTTRTSCPCTYAQCVPRSRDQSASVKWSKEQGACREWLAIVSVIRCPSTTCQEMINLSIQTHEWADNEKADVLDPDADIEMHKLVCVTFADSYNNFQCSLNLLISPLHQRHCDEMDKVQHIPSHQMESLPCYEALRYTTALCTSGACLR